MKYIIIKEKEVKSDIKFNNSFYISFLTKVLDFFVKRDFDFEDSVKNSKYWLIEFKYNDWNYTDEVQREIGLDENKSPILKLPNDKNKLGFWADEDVDFNFFIKHFEYKIITKQYFEEKWDEFI